MLSLTNVLNLSRPIVKNFVVIAKSQQPERTTAELEYLLESTIAKHYIECVDRKNTFYYDSMELTIKIIQYIAYFELKNIIERTQNIEKAL